MFFAYGEKEITYLKQKDKRLAEIIDKIGMIEREVDTDLFSAVIHHIIGQQISTKAQATIWKRMNDQYGTLTQIPYKVPEFPIYSHWELPSERQGILPILPEK